MTVVEQNFTLTFSVWTLSIQNVTEVALKCVNVTIFYREVRTDNELTSNESPISTLGDPLSQFEAF